MPMLSTKSSPSHILCTHTQDQYWRRGQARGHTGAEGWRCTSVGRRAAMARLDGFLWSLVETQETRVQTDLPDNYHAEISATSHRGQVRDAPGPRGAVTAPVRTCLTLAMDGGHYFMFLNVFSCLPTIHSLISHGVTKSPAPKLFMSTETQQCCFPQ